MHPARSNARSIVGPPRRWRPLSVRAVAVALLVSGLAAAGLALFAMTLIDPADPRFLVFCGTTDAEVEDPRDASGLLLLSAATQALALLVPRRALAVVACAAGSRACLHANVVVHRIVDCHGHVHGALALNYGIFLAVELAVFLAGLAIALFGHE